MTEEKIKKDENKRKVVNKILEKNNIPLSATPYIILLHKIKVLNTTLEELINEYDLDNKEIIIDSFKPFHKYITDELNEELEKVVEDYEDINIYFTSMGGSKDNNTIVLTPNYISEYMNFLLNLSEKSIVIDNCCGLGSLLLPAIDRKAKVIGIEYNPQIWSLCYLNILLKTKEKPEIYLGDSFELIDKIKYQPTQAIINPPYNTPNNGMEFIESALDKLVIGGRLAVIIQNSVGSGKATEINKRILEKHTLATSITLPNDIFIPFASVQTNIYLFVAHIPHDTKTKVRFVDFKDDGMKRTKRGITIKNKNRYAELMRITKTKGEPKYD